MFSARTENGPVTPRIVRGWAENLRVDETEPLMEIITADLHGEYDPAEASAEDHFNGAP